MSVAQRWSRSVAVGLVLLAWLALPEIARADTLAASPGATLEQCQNGTSGIGDCTGNTWVTGNLNPNNSLYREGDFVPFRSAITSLVAGRTYSLRIGYDALDKGLHAYDYLGSVDGSESAPGQQVVPCYGVAGTAGLHACGNGPSTLAVPEDTHTTFPSGASQAPGKFSAWGATLKDAAYVGTTPIGFASTNSVAREIDVTFTAAGDTVVLAWGGHIASTLDWGAGNTFISAASGSSFHMRLGVIREIGGPTYSTGNRELSLQATALAPVPSEFTTQVIPTSVAIGEPVIDIATLTGQPGVPVTGEVQFFLCFASGTPPDCSQGGLAIEPPQVVIAPSQNSPNGYAAIEFVPGTPGNYCFRAEYTPSAIAPYSPSAHTNTTTECFVATLPPPQLTVTKVCHPPNDPGLFNLLLDTVAILTDAHCGASKGPFETTAGAHTVSETAGTGTNLADYTSVIGGNCAADGSITLAAGDSATCTITNIRIPLIPASLTVNKVCIPPDDGGLFELHIDALRFPDVECGGTTGTVVLAPGTHTVGEAGGSNTSLSDYTSVISGDCASDGSITLAPGGTASCTITNTRIPPAAATLRVDKACVPAGDGGRFNLKIDGAIAGTGRNVGCGGTTGPVQVQPGSHTVSETAAEGTHLFRYQVVIGGDCAADGTVSVEAGEEATCLITNERKTVRPLPAQLAVVKICVPPDDGGLFNLTIDGRTSPDQACGDSFGPVLVSPGQHRVGETAGTGTDLSNYTRSIGGSCAPDGSITLSAGQSATCTITNARLQEDTGTVIIDKVCRPSRKLGRFWLEADQQLFQMACGQSTGPVVTGAGNHVIGEAAVNARPGHFKTTISGDCSRSGVLILSAGQQATCVVTNWLRPLRPLRPPRPACYRLTVSRRMVSAGKRVLVLARVRLPRRPIQGVRVYAVGPGVADVRTTGPRGRAVFSLRLRRAGILRLTIRRPFACPKPPSKKIGVLGASQTFLTG